MTELDFDLISYAETYLSETREILRYTAVGAIDDMAESLAETRGVGRVFVLGMGGSAATASHFVNDLRKLCDLEAYAPTDNVAEYSARVNDAGREGALEAWLFTSRLKSWDVVFFLSVGGGTPGVSECLTRAAACAANCACEIFAILGRDGGEVGKLATAKIIIPPRFSERVTPHTEGIASVLLHAIVSHPKLQTKKATW